MAKFSNFLTFIFLPIALLGVGSTVTSYVYNPEQKVTDKSIKMENVDIGACIGYKVANTEDFKLTTESCVYKTTLSGRSDEASFYVGDSSVSLHVDRIIELDKKGEKYVYVALEGNTKTGVMYKNKIVSSIQSTLNLGRKGFKYKLTDILLGKTFDLGANEEIALKNFHIYSFAVNGMSVPFSKSEADPMGIFPSTDSKNMQFRVCSCGHLIPFGMDRASLTLFNKNGFKKDVDCVIDIMNESDNEYLNTMYRMTQQSQNAWIGGASALEKITEEALQSMKTFEMNGVPTFVSQCVFDTYMPNVDNVIYNLRLKSYAYKNIVVGELSSLLNNKITIRNTGSKDAPVAFQTSIKSYRGTPRGLDLVLDGGVSLCYFGEGSKYRGIVNGFDDLKITSINSTSVAPNSFMAQLREESSSAVYSPTIKSNKVTVVPTTNLQIYGASSVQSSKNDDMFSKSGVNSSYNMSSSYGRNYSVNGSVGILAETLVIDGKDGGELSIYGGSGGNGSDGGTGQNGKAGKKGGSAAKAGDISILGKDPIVTFYAGKGGNGGRGGDDDNWAVDIFTSADAGDGGDGGDSAPAIEGVEKFYNESQNAGYFDATGGSGGAGGSAQFSFGGSYNGSRGREGRPGTVELPNTVFAGDSLKLKHLGNI